MRQRPASLPSPLAALVLSASLASTATAGEDVAAFLAKIDHPRGVCVVLADADGDLALDIAKRSELLVYTQLADDARVDAARRAALAAGIDASRFQVDRGPPDRLALADNIANAVIVSGHASRDPVSRHALAEYMRVLAPRGRVIAGDHAIRKPVPEGLDDWSHPYHGPDNNTLSRDRVIRAPYATQFLADPRYAPAPQVAVGAGGRLFKAFGHVAWHEREEPFLNTLAAFDGFNGTLLWKKALPEGYMIHRNTIAATDDVLYVGGEQSCRRIDTATGGLIDELRPPADIAGGTFWKWLAIEDGVLYALIGAQEPKDRTMRWKRRAHGWPWNEISKGYNVPEHPWGYGRTLVAMRPGDGKVLWHHREAEPADARALCMKNGRIFLFRFGSYLTAIDAKNGKELWRRTKESAPKLFSSIGAQLPRQGWQTNWRTTCYLKAGDGVIYFAGPQVGRLLAVSAEDGRVLWQDPYDNYQLIIRDDAVWAISGPWGNNVSKVFEPRTGKVLAELPTGRRACTRPSATSDSILFRAMGGSVRLDRDSGQPRWISPMRPQCQDGVTIANGQLYWWPYTCDCQLTLYGVISLGAADPDGPPRGSGTEHVERSARDAATLLDASAADWPTYRANNERTATTAARLPTKDVATLWTASACAPTKARPTAPVAAGGMVFYGDVDGVVRALDASSGKERWSVRTGGEVRWPPTIDSDRAYFGSADGYVYVHEAATGRSLWRFRAAPAARKIPVYGRLMSTWPAASGVLVDKDVAYVAAGLVNYDGTYIYALDAANGTVKWRNDTSGHLDPVAKTGVSVQGHLLLHGDKLYLAGGNAVSPAVYSVRDGYCFNDPKPLARCESTSPRGEELYLVGDRVIACGRPFYSRPEDTVYDHTVTKKLLHASNGERDVVWIDQNRLAVYEPLKREWLSRCVTDEKVPRHVTQAWGNFQVPAKPLWQQDTPGGVALAVSRFAVVVATRDRVEARALGSGQLLWAVPLPAAPVPWGLAVDRDGRAIVTLVDGRVVAIGAR